MGALDQAVRQGKALYAGISSYKPEQTVAAAALLRSLGTPCLIHQPSYSMFNRWVEDGLLDTLDTEGIGCIAFSVLSQGLLTERYLDGIPDDSRAAKPHGFLKPDAISSGYLAKARALRGIARDRGQTLAQMAVAWVLRRGTVTSALLGASRVEQIEETVGALSNTAFSTEQLRRIDRVLASDKRRRSRKGGRRSRR